jgi:hypothetical protein
MIIADQYLPLNLSYGLFIKFHRRKLLTRQLYIVYNLNKPPLYPIILIFAKGFLPQFIPLIEAQRVNIGRDHYKTDKK